MGWQVAPDGSDLVHVPTSPLVGAVDASHGFAEHFADLEVAVASRDQQIDELRSELSDIVSRLEAVESG